MIVVFGENIIDFIEIAEDSYSAALGGSPFNFSIGVAKQGVKCTYLSPISSDSYGEKLFLRLTASGGIYGFHRRSEKPSSLALIPIGDEESPQYTLYREGVADRDYSVDEVLSCIPESVRFFHTGSLVLVPDELIKLIEIIKVLKVRGVKLSLDINIRQNSVSDLLKYRGGIISIIPYFSYVKASDEDLEFLYPGLSPNKAAQEVLGLMDNGLVAFTKGAEGAELITETAHVSLPIVPVGDFKDTVGAGDTFFSNLISYFFDRKFDEVSNSMLSRESLSKALQYALTAATINVERHGCNPPTKSEVLARLG